MRFKNRYLLMELVWRDGKTANQFNEAALFGVVQKVMQLHFGDYGAAMASASLSVRYLNPVTNLCIIRCSTEQYRQVWAALTMVTDVQHRRMLFRFVHLGGTLKSARVAALEFDAKARAGMRLSAQVIAAQWRHSLGAAHYIKRRTGVSG